MILCFTADGWADYVQWQTQDRKTLKRVNLLINAIARDPLAGIGRPEQLRGDWTGWWSREIDSKNRIIYRVVGDQLEIAQCAGHYADH